VGSPTPLPFEGDAVLTSLGKATHVVFFSVSKNIFGSSPPSQNPEVCAQSPSGTLIGEHSSSKSFCAAVPAVRLERHLAEQ
jgi:hypothetical protein